jgi:DnaJ family protein C protein 1
VLAFLVVLTSGLHYLVMRLNYARDVRRVAQLVDAARLAAWGPKLVPVDGRRKVKVPLSGAARADENGNVFSGRTIDVVVESSGDVFLVCAARVLARTLVLT